MRKWDADTRRLDGVSQREDFLIVPSTGWDADTRRLNRVTQRGFF